MSEDMIKIYFDKVYVQLPKEDIEDAWELLQKLVDSYIKYLDELKRKKTIVSLVLNQ